jgi:hypothetical protein
MIKSILTNPKDQKSLQTLDGWEDYPVLVVTSYQNMKGVFKSVSRTMAGTSILTKPVGDGSIVLTDLIITTDNIPGSVVIQFTDGTHTEIITSVYVTSASCNIATTFTGNWQGWEGARIEVVTDSLVKTTVSCGYFKLPNSKALGFDEWNHIR